MEYDFIALVVKKIASLTFSPVLIDVAHKQPYLNLTPKQPDDQSSQQCNSQFYALSSIQGEWL